MRLINLVVKFLSFLILDLLFIDITVYYMSSPTNTLFSLHSTDALSNPAVSICLVSKTNNRSNTLFANIFESFYHNGKRCYRFNQLESDENDKYSYTIEPKVSLEFVEIYVHKKSSFPKEIDIPEAFLKQSNTGNAGHLLIFDVLIIDRTLENGYSSNSSEDFVEINYKMRTFSLIPGNLAITVQLEGPVQKILKVVKFDLEIYLIYVGGLIGCISGLSVLDTDLLIVAMNRKFSIDGRRFKYRRITNLLILLFCTSGFSYQMLNLLRKYLEYNVTSNANIGMRNTYVSVDAHLCLNPTNLLKIDDSTNETHVGFQL